MSVWRIASRFFRNDWKRYVAFVGSTAFTVMIYFLYTALIMHPNLQSGYPYAKCAVQGMKAAAVVIAIFAFLFLLCSSSSFVRLRMKELGLLSLLGVSKRQLIQIILGENLIIAAVSLAAGLGAGLLLIGGYLWAGSSNPTMVLTGVIPVTLIVSVATIILMREASIACLAWLHGCGRYYYRTGPFLTIS